ncbi:hypothetical protein CLV76_14014 [Marivita geojedonensis]|nr:hypothetical protein [Marivita geojedonensis]PRY71835.1 hypothetical protein CLV76_14014 [Marivita geojedonensis]
MWFHTSFRKRKHDVSDRLQAVAQKETNDLGAYRKILDLESSSHTRLERLPARIPKDPIPLPFFIEIDRIRTRIVPR